MKLFAPYAGILKKVRISKIKNSSGAGKWHCVRKWCTLNNKPSVDIFFCISYLSRPLAWQFCRLTTFCRILKRWEVIPWGLAMENFVVKHTVRLVFKIASDKKQFILVCGCKYKILVTFPSLWCINKKTINA